MSQILNVLCGPPLSSAICQELRERVLSIAPSNAGQPT